MVPGPSFTCSQITHPVLPMKWALAPVGLRFDRWSSLYPQSLERRGQAVRINTKDNGPIVLLCFCFFFLHNFFIESWGN